MLHPMIFYATYLCELCNTLLLQNRITSDKPKQDEWLVMEVACLIVIEFDLTSLAVAKISIKFVA